MNSRYPRTEIIAYLLAFLLALGLRLILLGQLPLTDSEATLALQALKIAQGEPTSLSSPVAYVNLTAVLFFVFGSFNFLARLVPALVGSALVFAPALFRGWLRPRAMIILAFFLAIDPGLVALSRQVGSPILAVTFSAFAVGLWLQKKPRLAGVFAALALLSGPAFWAGLLGVLLAWMISHFLTGSPVEAGTQGETEPAPRNTKYSLSITNYQLPISAIITILLASSLFLLVPHGLGAWLTALPDYLRGWVTPSAVPSSRLYIALGVYQLLGLVWAVIAIVRGWLTGSAKIIRLSLWMLVALLLASFYPARQTADLAWTLLPLWTLAALEFSHHLTVSREDRLETAGVIVFTLLLLGFIWMDFIAMYFTPITTAEGQLRLGLLVGALVLLIISVTLVAYGWSERIARVGSAWGVIIILGLYTLGSAWGASGLRNPKAVELWDAGMSIAQADLLTQTANQVSEWATGQADDLPVTIYGVDSPALLWALRHRQVEVVLALDPASAPSLVITPPQQDLQLASAYRGQDFSWRQSPVWESFPSFTLQWLTLRELPTQSETIILWARNDLFIDARKP